MKTAISVTNLNQSYGKNQILSDLSFNICLGDFFIIIGPNGSGKTTLMKLISGILTSYEGKLNILEKPINHYSKKELSKILAFVPQSMPTDFPFTVSEMVLMGRTPYLGLLGSEKKKDLEICYESMEFTGIKHLEDRKLSQLSGGERQRVFIAKAICQKPKIILLDEPTAALDIANQIRIMDLMEKLKQEQNITVVMVSHDINLASMYADTLLILKDGKVVEIGLPLDIITYKTIEKAYNCLVLVNESPLGKYPNITLVPGKFRK